MAKKKLLPFYQKVKESDPELWRGWDIDDALEALLVRTLRMKPMRTASGVATVTVDVYKRQAQTRLRSEARRIPRAWGHRGSRPSSTAHP